MPKPEKPKPEKLKPPIPNADEVDEASDESFPASDPPANQPIHPGPPGKHPDHPPATPPKRRDRAS
jgi:hypothetical protein